MNSWIYKIAHPFLLVYWFIFRPKTQGVKCLLVSDDEVLLVRHSYGNPTWTIPGGEIKKRESPEEAVIREIKEELGFNIKPQFLGQFTHNTEYKIDTVYYFLSQVERLEPIVTSAEIQEAQWWRIDALPEKHSTGLDRALKLLDFKAARLHIL